MDAKYVLGSQHVYIIKMHSNHVDLLQVNVTSILIIVYSLKWLKKESGRLQLSQRGSQHVYIIKMHSNHVDLLQVNVTSIPIIVYSLKLLKKESGRLQLSQGMLYTCWDPSMFTLLKCVLIMSIYYR